MAVEITIELSGIGLIASHCGTHTHNVATRHIIAKTSSFNHNRLIVYPILPSIAVARFVHCKMFLFKVPPLSVLYPIFYHDFVVRFDNACI